MSNPVLRCAIYTRKSTSEGLEQDFNTLDAQRESCLAYITSQKGEGWIAMAEQYDDGGYTGANTERPALQQLIEDIKRRAINCVVVYKVDRLSRSLLDFSKLLEFFDEYEVTFVSVTQNFNTKTSMGRLTLNILLSFAQFEREIISERTRDKMSAARRKGKFAGGRAPFGYIIDRKNTKLLVDEKERENIKFMFETFTKVKNTGDLRRILAERNIEHREITHANGKTCEARRFGKQTVYSMLRNPVYIGKVLHNGEVFDGEHEPIITEELFNAVNEILNRNRAFTKYRNESKANGLFKGLLFCKSCNASMWLTYTKKKSGPFYYYVCNTAKLRGYDKCPTKTINQKVIEEVIIKKLINKAVINEITWANWDYFNKTDCLRSVLKKICYDGVESKIEIVLQNDITINIHGQFKNIPAKKCKKPESNAEKIDKDEYYATLALQLKEYMKVHNLTQKECAKALGITPSRINQILATR